ncbi:UNVERIFIED_CONTAM: hypothetical protein Sangu_1163500 [Sesamum angustifolium]|uniref:Uncharacterized protein n=1 Tax=Sesamum angustifolium TaxID=2727405 RepID=A0AAW2P0F1_9LAMI
MISTHVVRIASLCEEFFSCLQGTPPISQGDAQKRKLEDKVGCLGTENAKLKETKKEVVSRYQQVEKDLKKLQKEVIGHAEAIGKAAEQARLDFPNTKEGK